MCLNGFIYWFGIVWVRNFVYVMLRYQEFVVFFWFQLVYFVCNLIDEYVFFGVMYYVKLWIFWFDVCLQEWFVVEVVEVIDYYVVGVC